MRMTKGWCYMDVWEFNSWFTEIAPQMLRHMADYGMAYPGGEPFDTPEKWHTWLHNMAIRLEKCGEDPIDITESQNEYAARMDEIMEAASKRWRENNPDKAKNCSGVEFTPEEEEIRNKFFKREKEIDEEMRQFIQDTFTELGKHWWCIWD